MNHELSRINKLSNFYEYKNYDNALMLISVIEEDHTTNPYKMSSEEFLGSKIYKSRILFLKNAYHEALEEALNIKSYLNVRNNPEFYFTELVALIGPKISLAKFDDALEEINDGMTLLKILDIQIYEKIKFEISEFLNMVAIYYDEIGNYEYSIKIHKECLKLREDIGDKNKIVASYNRLGNAYKLYGKYEKSFHYYEEALHIEEELTNAKEMAITLINLGMNYDEYGQTDKALDCFNKSLIIFQSSGDSDNEAHCYFRIANLYKRINNLNKALEFFKLASKAFKEIDNDLHKTMILFHLLHLHILLNQPEEAQEKLNEIKEILKKNNFIKITQYYVLGKALILKESNSPRNHVKAEYLFETIINNQSLPFYVIVIAIMSKCELLITEILDNITNENEIIVELENTLQNFVSLVESQKNYALIAESYWLTAQLFYLKKDYNNMKKYLLEAKDIAEEKKLYHFLKKMSLNSNKFFEKNSSLKKYFKKSVLLLKQNGIGEKITNEQNTTKPYIPSKLLILAKTGHLLYAYNFKLQEPMRSDEDLMVTGFLSAINAFSQKLFAGFIDYMKIENNQIIFKYSDPIFFYLVFEGNPLKAIKKLSKIIKKITSNKHIWNDIKSQIEDNRIVMGQEKVKFLSELIAESN